MENQIRSLREQSGMSRKQLCELGKIPYRTLQDWELGKRKPPLYVIEYIKLIIRDAKK